EIEEAAATVPPELLDGAYAQVGVAWDAICSAAREHDVDLIVIGSHGYGLLDRLLGTTAAKVVNHADRSVLVVRARGLTTDCRDDPHRGLTRGVRETTPAPRAASSSEARASARRPSRRACPRERRRRPPGAGALPPLRACGAPRRAARH